MSRKRCRAPASPRVAVVAVVAVLAALTGCGGTPPDSGATGATGAASPAPASASQAPSPDLAGTPEAPSPRERTLPPGRAIAVEPHRGALIEIEISTGRIVGQLEAGLGAAGLGEGVGSLDHSPARDSVVLSRVITGARQEIVEVPLDGGEGRVVAIGHTAAVAPEGERVAVGRRELGEEGPDLAVLEVRAIDGDLLRRWTAPSAAEEPVMISQLTWSPDGDRVAFELGFEDGTEVRTLDVTAPAGSLQEASRKVPPPGDLRMLSVPEFRPGVGTLVAVDGPGLDPDADQRFRVVALDADSSAVTAVLVETGRPVTVLDFDQTGQRLLYVEGHGHRAGRDDSPSPPALFHWHDGTTTKVARDVTNATW